MNKQALWQPVLYLAGVVLALGVAVAFIAAIRRWARRGGPESETVGLTLGQARQLKAKGLLTEQEFDELKRVIVEGSHSNTSGGQPKSAL